MPRRETLPVESGFGDVRAAISRLARAVCSSGRYRDRMPQSPSVPPVASAVGSPRGGPDRDHDGRAAAGPARRTHRRPRPQRRAQARRRPPGARPDHERARAARDPTTRSCPKKGAIAPSASSPTACGSSIRSTAPAKYGEGRQDWAVHIALVIANQPVAGAVALPALGLTLSTADPSAAARRCTRARRA